MGLFFEKNSSKTKSTLTTILLVAVFVDLVNAFFLGWDWLNIVIMVVFVMLTFLFFKTEKHT